MRVSRASERRGGPGKGMLILGMVAVVLIVGGLVTFLTGSFDSIGAENGDAAEILDVAANLDATGEEAKEPASTVAPTAEPTVAPEPTAKATATTPPTAAPTATPDTSNDGPRMPKVYPETGFGEVLDEGLVELELTGGVLADAWYTFQVDTRTQEITLLFAVYDDELETIISTAKISNYTEGRRPETVEITQSYPNSPPRTLKLDSGEGKLTVTQQFQLPLGPSLFSPDLRFSLIYYGMVFFDDSRNKRIDLHLDITGLSEAEILIFEDSAPESVEDGLDEINVLVKQIEDKR